MRLVDHADLQPPTPPEEPPVPINPVSPVRYPPALLAQGIEGQVLLRLYVDSAGRVVPDSIRIAESSGYPALDSAALVGAPELRFSPALHQGRPVAAPFLQPVQFRGPRPAESDNESPTTLSPMRRSWIRSGGRRSSTCPGRPAASAPPSMERPSMLIREDRSRTGSGSPSSRPPNARVNFARGDHRRGNQRQYRGGPRHRGGAQRLSLCVYHARQDVAGKSPIAQGVRSGSRHHPDGGAAGPSRQLCDEGKADRQGNTGRGPGKSVL